MCKASNNMDTHQNMRGWVPPPSCPLICRSVSAPSCASLSHHCLRSGVGVWSQTVWLGISALTLTSCRISVKSLNLCVSDFLCKVPIKDSTFFYTTFVRIQWQYIQQHLCTHGTEPKIALSNFLLCGSFLLFKPFFYQERWESQQAWNEHNPFHT